MSVCLFHNKFCASHLSFHNDSLFWNIFIRRDNSVMNNVYFDYAELITVVLQMLSGDTQKLVLFLRWVDYLLFLYSYNLSRVILRGLNNQVKVWIWLSSLFLNVDLIAAFFTLMRISFQNVAALIYFNFSLSQHEWLVLV